ncbi:MAG: DNA polymerase III subunit beta [Acidobacteria bacterium]|nr:MAG: DNA polymerase III subunit beta [Acidobacteriota bacterium]
MDIRLNRVELLRELVPMQGIVERRSTIPVLSHLLLRAIDDRLEVAATDLEVSLTSSCEAEVEEEGAIALQAKKLLEIVRACEGDDVALSLDSETQTVSLAAGKSRFKIRGLPADDFPTLPSLEADGAVEVAFPTFKKMVGKVFFAVSSEESRFQLAGALLEQREGALTLVATDGHRLALVESEVEGLEAADSVLVPRKALQELLRLEDEADLHFRRGEHHLSFTVGRRQLICRVLEGTFPDYERVIARDNDKHVVLPRQSFAAAIQRVSLLTGDRARSIRLNLRDGELELTAANPDLGEAREDLPCEYQGEELSVGLNPDYLKDFLGAVETDTVRLELKDEDSQCVAYPVDGDDRRYLCVIMPIRI